MARKSKKAREMDEIKEKIKSSLIKQLRAKGAETAHFLDIIDDYMEFYDTKKGSTRGHKGTWSVVQDTFCKRIRDHKTEPVCERYGGCRKADVEHPEGVRTDDG